MIDTEFSEIRACGVAIDFIDLEVPYSLWGIDYSFSSLFSVFCECDSYIMPHFAFSSINLIFVQ